MMTLKALKVNVIENSHLIAKAGDVGIHYINFIILKDSQKTESIH